MSGLPALPLLAVQVWDAFGWAGQAVFTWRTVEQWFLSEKAKASVLPKGFWAWSLIGTAFLAVYAIHRRDPVYLLGTTVNGCFFVRNLWLSRRPDGIGHGKRVLWPIVLGLLLFSAVVVEALGPNHGLVRFNYAFLWLCVGFLGQAFWIGRMVVQTTTSERVGQSVLPPSYFWGSLVGALLLFAYAISRTDWVNMAAYGPNAIPYARNLILLRRGRKGSEAKGVRGSESGAGPASA